MPDQERTSLPDPGEIEDVLRDMQKKDGESTGLDVAGLTPDQLDVLAQKVYILLRQELVIEQERLGRRR